MKLYRRMAAATSVMLALDSLVGAQSWTPLTNQPPAGVGVMLQLRDGRVLVDGGFGGSDSWYVLTPDATGSYLNGTWSSGGKTTALGCAPDCSVRRFCWMARPGRRGRRV